MPEGRIPPQTWIVPAAKRQESYQWLSQQLQGNQTQTAILVCPFINKSKNEEFAHIPSASERFDQLKAFFAKQQPHLRIALLHGKMKKKDKNQISQQLFAQQIDLLITTPVVEVGIDVPTASIIIIEAGERFGMASLHQLRGRVGRAGQSSYCLVFTSKESGQENARLKEFSQNHDGLKLAELDLQRRGAGDLFGLRQHGLDNLRFTDWTNLSLISQARKIYDQLETEANWQSFLPIQETSSSPVAN
jgi:ATP-dependent DNA helicase RecG